MQIGFPGLLFLVFLILKLTGYIAWAWVWITAPLWISFAVTMTLLIGVFAFSFLASR